MTKLNNGEGSDGTAAVQKIQMLPDNGVLWNLDRIDQRSLPLDREYTCGIFLVTCTPACLSMSPQQHSPDADQSLSGICTFQNLDHIDHHCLFMNCLCTRFPSS